MSVRVSILFGLVALAFSASSFAYYDNGFYNDNTAQVRQDRWMQHLPNNRMWMNLSLPATHDSAATRGGVWAETQSMSIEQQLRAGVRWFDLRAKWEGDYFPIYHGAFYQGQDLNDVLATMQAFLSRNPSESLTVRLSKEGESGWHTYGSFGETFEMFYRRPRGNLFWMRHKDGSRDVDLGSIRGKIYLLYDFEPKLDASGEYYPGSYYRNCDIQDQYDQGPAHNLYRKWEAVKHQINRANGRWGGYNCYINYLSASGVMAPYFWAGGRAVKWTSSDRLSTGVSQWGHGTKWPDLPRHCWGKWCIIYYEGINTLTKNYLNRHRHIKYVGAMPADFPGHGLIQAIINVNFR